MLILLEIMAVIIVNLHIFAVRRQTICFVANYFALCLDPYFWRYLFATKFMNQIDDDDDHVDHDDSVRISKVTNPI